MFSSNNFKALGGSIHTKYPDRSTLTMILSNSTPSLSSKIKGHHQTFLFQLIGEGLQHTPRLTHQHSCTGRGGGGEGMEKREERTR